MNIREFTLADYDQVYKLWRVCRLSLGPEDTEEALARKLERDPDLFLVAELNRAIVGAVMGAWDGRYGTIYNHAVEPRARGSGVGSHLMWEVERRLREKGARQVWLRVGRESLEAVDFYEGRGFQADSEQVVMSKTLSPA